LSRDAQEFIPLTEDAARAVSGPSSRHAALIEDAFRVLVETPGGGVLLKGDSAGRVGAKRAVQTIAARAETGAEVGEADVRVAITAARTGEPGPSGAAPPRPPPRPPIST
jgi:phosphate starvation-inducible PhoH-like protein